MFESIISFLKNNHATILSICAVSISIWSVRKKIIHDRKSVKPIINILFEVQEKSHINVTINNHGTGPGIITSLKTNRKNKEIDLFSYIDEHVKRICSLFKVSQISLHQVQTIQKKRALKEGQQISVMKVALSDNVNYNNEIYKVLIGLEFYVEYEDIYENKFDEKETLVAKNGSTSL